MHTRAPLIANRVRIKAPWGIIKLSATVSERFARGPPSPASQTTREYWERETSTTLWVLRLCCSLEVFDDSAKPVNT